MGSKIGSMKVAAKRIGISYEKYIQLIDSGYKWCTKCRSWKSVKEFGRDSTRSDGLDAKCFSCRSTTKSGPTKRERKIKLESNLSWCNKCQKWLPSEQIKGGQCKLHRAEYARLRYHNDYKHRLERKQHSHSRKRQLFPIPSYIQEEILAKFDGRCAYCFNAATTWDHVVPVSRGGNSTPGNIIPCCQSCNSSKKDRDLYEWIETKDINTLHPDLLDILALAECVRY